MESDVDSELDYAPLLQKGEMFAYLVDDYVPSWYRSTPTSGTIPTSVS